VIDRSAFDPARVAPDTAAVNALVLGEVPPLPDTGVGVRALVDQMMQAMGGPSPRSDHARTVGVPASAASLRVFPQAPDAPVVVHVHGGGWTFGSADMSDAVLEALSAEISATVVSVEIRLAPEHPHPAAVDDCEAALRYLTGRARPFGSGRVALVGESSGANVALAALLRLRVDGVIPSAVCGASLFYGAYDLTMTPSQQAWGPSRGMVNTTSLEQFYAFYVPDPAGRRDPDVSPLYADLRGLPPVSLVVGTFDPLLDDSTFLAARLAAAGVPTELTILPGACHGFDQLPMPLEISVQARAQRSAFLRGVLAGADAASPMVSDH
jgi:acetyl esterase/lipase